MAKSTSKKSDKQKEENKKPTEASKGKPTSDSRGSTGSKRVSTAKKTAQAGRKSAGAGTKKASGAAKASKPGAGKPAAKETPEAKSPKGRTSKAKTTSGKAASPKRASKGDATKPVSPKKAVKAKRNLSTSESTRARRAASAKGSGVVKESTRTTRDVPPSKSRKKPSPSAKTKASPAVQSTDSGTDHFSLFSDFDIDLFKAGKHFNLYDKLGSKVVNHNGTEGTYFAVWAPNARNVHVIGNFNSWNKESHPMNSRWDGSGIWETFIPGLGKGEFYKYFIESQSGYTAEKGDPYAFHWETPPATSSVVWNFDYEWRDKKWMDSRKKNTSLNRPISVYEMHLGSWRKKDNDGKERFMTYKEMADELPGYCEWMGFTHVEMMPVMEHPFFGSWGYQITGYFAPSSRFGTPEDFMHLVDALHQAGIGVILDWVPSHYPTDLHGLHFFDGTHLYEHADPRKGFHPDWKSDIFNYGRNEVREFLISNALYWLDKFHIDGLRVDAVASMLYLDYSREEGQWIPNEYGGRENLEAISFLQEFNQAVHYHFKDAFTIAEESTAYPGVTHSVENNGLGFDMKWMMGWMHDTLNYMQKDPVHRTHHHDQITFSLHYAFSEKYVLPLSHDEVVYGKNSLINKMPGDEWQQFANLRLLYSYMYGHPGGKMIFMGGEFAQRHEWRHDYSLDWDENNHSLHNGVQKLLKELNELYKSEPALYEENYSQEGFEWIDYQDRTNSVLAWIRKGKNPKNRLFFVANFTPVVRENYRVGMPERGFYKEIFNSDNEKYGGSNRKAGTNLETAPVPAHGKEHSLSLTLPPLGVTILKFDPDRKPFI